MRDPGFAAVLSAIIPGVGQFYNGRILAGILWLISLLGCGSALEVYSDGYATSSRPTPPTATLAITGCVSLRPRVFLERWGREIHLSSQARAQRSGTCLFLLQSVRDSLI